MATSYIFPTIIALPLGYRTVLNIPTHQIQERLVVPDANVLFKVMRYVGGQCTELASLTLSFKKGQICDPDVPPIVVADLEQEGFGEPGYLEIETESIDGALIFASKRVISTYTVYACDGKTSFLSDNAYKYGAPPIIAQMARFKKFVLSYPVLRIDRENDFE